MIQFPYGIADFRRIRREGMVYIDRTAWIHDLEALGSILVFLRPRRFGKSLWIQTLATYYDLRYKDDFDEIFSGLDIGPGETPGPTPLRSTYFVLQWNFSLVSPRGGVPEIAREIQEHVRSQVEAFVADYEEYLPAPVRTDGSPQNVLISLLSVIRKTSHKLYLLIDEYDNFINEVMARDVETYKALFEADGPYKELFKAVKNATEGLGLERVFVTGVSPVALNDLTSGFNTSKNVSLEPELAALCGFREREIRDVFALTARDRGLSDEMIFEVVDVMRTWYNGYRFSEDSFSEDSFSEDSFSEDSFSEDEGTLVYNPTNTLYFLDHFHRRGKAPRRLHDANLRTDQAKLAFLARTAAGTDVIEDLTEGTGEIQISQLLDTFSLGDLIPQLSQDKDAVASFLYYMGLLTLTDDPGALRIPNLVVRKLFLDRLLEVYLPNLAASSEARRVAMRFFSDGNLVPLLAFFEEKLLPVLSNRDQGAPPKEPERDGRGGSSGSGVNEMVLKALFLSILFDDQRFVLHSELEVEKGYVDLCLRVRPENRYPNAFDILFEFKLVRRKTLAKKGRELRAMDEAELRGLSAVETALAEARAQVERYRDGLVRQHGVRPRGYVVVAVGLERLVGDEV